jgi:hypothetical protein
MSWVRNVGWGRTRRKDVRRRKLAAAKAAVLMAIVERLEEKR